MGRVLIPAGGNTWRSFRNIRGGSVTTVRQAMEALKPDLVRASQARHGVRHGDLKRRRNAGFVRQGEWYFVPDPTFDLRGLPWHTDEPLVRGRGKPHIAERLVRFGAPRCFAIVSTVR